MISFQFDQTEDSEDDKKIITEIETTKLFDVKSEVTSPDSSKIVKTVYGIDGPSFVQSRIQDEGRIHKPLYRIVPNTHGHAKKPKLMDVEEIVEVTEPEKFPEKKNLEDRLRTMEFKYLGALKQINKLGSEVKQLQKQVEILFKERGKETPYETLYYNRD